MKTTIFVIMFLMGAPLAAQTLPEQLQAIDTVPTKEMLQRLSTTPLLDLESAACDVTLTTYERRRAISFMSLFGQEALAGLTRIARTCSEDASGFAVYTLVRTVPNSGVAIDLALRSVQKSSPNVWAIRSLRWFDHGKIEPILKRLELQPEFANEVITVRLKRSFVR